MNIKYEVDRKPGFVGYVAIRRRDEEHADHRPEELLDAIHADDDEEAIELCRETERDFNWIGYKLALLQWRKVINGKAVETRTLYRIKE